MQAGSPDAPDFLEIASPAGRAVAKIAPRLGLNCFQLAVDGIELLWAEPDFAAGGGRPSGSGLPLLFPFPGRIAGTTFSWRGRDYPLEPGDAFGNAIHGFVHTRAWRVREHRSDRLTAVFQASVDDPDLLTRWPADFQIEASYTVSDRGLRGEYQIAAFDEPLPWGLGLHPYFRVPLGGADRDGCLVRSPATQQWRLAEMVATGERGPSPEQARLAAGIPFGEMQFDAVFSGMAIQPAGQIESTLDDPAARRRLKLACSGLFRECVVYNPGHREAVCIEPYTCCPGAFDLESRGIDAGGRILLPGETATLWIEIELQTL